MKYIRMFLLLVFFLPPGCNLDSEAARNSPDNSPQTAVSQESLSAENSQHFWVTMEKAQDLALQNSKYIVMDVYTEWCGFCRRMNQQTYNDQRVVEMLDSYFYPVRIDAESDQKVTLWGETLTMRQLAFEFGVSSYPTTIFLSSEAEPVAVQPGFIPAEQFYKILSYVGTESYLTLSFDQYAAGLD